MSGVTHYFHHSGSYSLFSLENSHPLCGSPEEGVQGCTDLGRVTCIKCIEEAGRIATRVSQLYTYGCAAMLSDNVEGT